MKTVVVTGATSFLGTHLCLAFAGAGWRVIAARSRPDRAYDGIQADRLALLADKTDAATFDITDADAVAEIVQTFAPDLWVHHAGYATGHADADFDLMRGLRINGGSIPPLFNALRSGGCGVIVTGTEAEYPASDTPRSEDMVGTPRSPYGLSKLAETMATEQYAAITGVPARVARVFLPVGPLDHPGKLFPQVIAALKAGKPIDLTPCKQRRDLIAVADVGRAYLKIADDLARGGFDIFNVGSGEACPLAESLAALADTLAAPRDLLRFGRLPGRINEPDVIQASVKKLKRLGWAAEDRLFESAMEFA